MSEILSPSQMFWTQHWLHVARNELCCSNEASRWLTSLAGSAIANDCPEISSFPPICYDVTYQPQRPAQCMQTAATTLLGYYIPSTTVEHILGEVPVYEENGRKIGTAPGHIGAYMARQLGDMPECKGVTTYVFDTELFPSIGPTGEEPALDPVALITFLKQRQQNVPAQSWLAKYGHVVIDGWQKFADAGGNFCITRLSRNLLYGLLFYGPYFVMLSSTVLSNRGRRTWDTQLGAFVPDDVCGTSSTHELYAQVTIKVISSSLIRIRPTTNLPYGVSLKISL